MRPRQFTLMSLLEEAEKNHGIQPSVRLTIAQLLLEANQEFSARIAIRLLKPVYPLLLQEPDRFRFRLMAGFLGKAHRRLRSKTNADFWFALSHGKDRALDEIERRFDVVPAQPKERDKKSPVQP